MSAANIPVGWQRWENSLRDVDEQCLSFTEDICREVALQHGFKAVNVRWEPHNWSGGHNDQDRMPHDWHITADFETPEGYAKTAHIYTSSGDPEWLACRRPDGTIKAIFQDDLVTYNSCPWGPRKARSMPELRHPPRVFELARPRARKAMGVAATAKSWRRNSQPDLLSAPKDNIMAFPSWREPCQNSLPEISTSKKDIRALSSWR